MRNAVLVSLSLSFFVGACGDNVREEADAAVDAGPQTVALTFAARVNGSPFACGQTYAGVGMAGSSYTGTDFRFYISNIRLLSSSSEVSVELEVNDYQRDGVALLDFETGGTGCQQGSPGTHTAVTGTVPAASGPFTGIAFTVGIPFEKNHLDVTTATPPLDVPAMFWAWSSGYKFLKADGAVAGQGFNLHLGSTGCDTMGTTPATTCSNANSMPITLSGFSPDSSVVVADVARVLTDVDVSTNTMNTAAGCMSFPNDPECTTIFPKLGLAYGAAAAASQTLFTVE